MTALLDMLWSALLWTLRASAHAALLVALVLLAQGLLRRRLAPRWRYALWMLVLVRLVMPGLPRSPLSVYGLLWPMAPAPVAAKAPGPLAPPAMTDNPWLAPDAILAVPVDPGAAQPSRPQPETALLTSLPPPAAGVTIPPPASAAAARTARSDWPRVAIPAAWLIGASIVIARLLIGAVKLIRALRAATVPSPFALEVLDRCRCEVRVRRQVRLLEVRGVEAPGLCGLLRPTLLLPPRLAEALTAAELRFVLLHELAHLKRRDLWVQALTELLLALHWFNPLLWLARARMRSDRELACDAAVLARAGDRRGRLAYGRTILKLLERTTGPAALAGAVGVLEDRHLIRRRITMIANAEPRNRRWTAVAALLIAALAVATLTDARGQDGPPGPPSSRPATAGRQVRPPQTQPGHEDLDAATERKLQAILPVVELRGVELADALDFLRDVGEVSIVVNWNALGIGGVTEVTPVNIQLANVTVEKALRTILDSVGGLYPLSFALDGGVVTISTKDDLSTWTTVRVYDVRGLLPRDRKPPVTELDPENGILDDGDDGPPISQATADLLTVIRNTIDPTSWIEYGGTVGSIEEVDGLLVVTQTAENHRAVEQLLTELRERMHGPWRDGLFERLQEPIPQVDLAQVPFGTAIDFLRQATDVTIVLHPDVPRDRPLITIQAPNLTPEQVLSLMTRMAGLKWEPVEGVILINR